MHATMGVERGGLMDNTLGLSTGRSGVRIPGRGKCSRKTTAFHARVKYPLTLLNSPIYHDLSCVISVLYVLWVGRGMWHVGT